MQRRLFESAWLGSQAFEGAAAFNQNLAAWNVLCVTTYFSAFTGVGLADCIKRGVYDNWGLTLQGTYPTWSSLSSVCAITNSNVKTAATAWLTDPVMATKAYGNIADWNTAPVTSMDRLFSAAMAFNADISKWNVASVSNMDQV
jgi:surface protein